MPKVTEAHVEARRLQIIEAAAICFAEKGFHHTTMQEICRTAGLSPGALYSYFASKEELIGALVAEADRGNEMIMAQFRDQRTAADSLRELSRIYLSCLECEAEDQSKQIDPYRMKVGLWAEGIRNEELRLPFRDSFRKVLAEMTEVLRRGQQRGEVLSGIDLKAAAQIIASMHEGYALLKAIDESTDSTKYFATLMAILEGGLLRSIQTAVATEGETDGK